MKILFETRKAVFTIQRTIHIIKGDNWNCFFLELCPFFNLDYLLHSALSLLLL